MEVADLKNLFIDSVRQARRSRRTLFVLGTAVAYGIAVYLAIALTRNGTNVAVIWPANGILLAALLAARGASTRHLLVAACLLANALAAYLNGDPWSTLFAFAILGVGECMLAYRMMRAISGRRVDFTKAWTVIAFVAVCATAPIIPSVAGALIASEVYGADFRQALSTWYLSDVLGLLVLTPAILLLWPRTRIRGFVPSNEDVVRHFLLLGGASLVVFVQSAVPLLFLLIPISVLIAFRLGPRYTAMATLWLTAVSLICTYQGWGPAALIEDAAMRISFVQLFCFVNLLTSLAVAAEIADRERLRRELVRVSTLASDRHRQLHTALDSMSQGVCLFDDRSRVVVRNNRFLEIYGLRDEVVRHGTSLAALMSVCRGVGAVPERDSASVDLNADDDFEQQLVGGRHIRISQRVLSDGGVICTYSDVTQEKQAEKELLHRTLHDVLTGVPNRRLLVERIDAALVAAKDGKQCAVMLIDIDYFKSINDSMGHAAGDELLRVVADRLCSCVRNTDTIARLGGDEFAVLLIEGEHKLDPGTVARRFLDAIKKPMHIDGKLVRVGMSIGIAQPPTDGGTTDEILKSADVALYKAKRNGRGNYAFFDANTDAGECSARRLEGDLRRALEESQFRVVYQPIKSGGSGDVAAIEALIRWHHPELGLVPPADFIPLAERNGLINDIGDWVLDQACRDAARLPPGVRVSVNLSRVQISDPAFATRVSEVLSRTGLPPERLELEVTETAILHNETNACKVLGELQALGISIAIDDFGVGQSALSCLRSLPIGRIKIDRSFINDLATDAKARNIFIAVVSLAKSLGIKTTAEGIETEQQRVIAALAGCDHLQGYLLGRPQDLDRLVTATSTAGTELELPLGLAV